MAFDKFTEQQIREHRDVFGAAAKHGKKWCHLIADDDDELHDFAVTKLGLKRDYAQSEGSIFLHYDLVPSMRYVAVFLGAREVTARELVTIMRKKRHHATTARDDNGVR